ncbi:MAG: polyphosphate kinase 2 family protein, partial [Anaerolineae bacterium]
MNWQDRRVPFGERIALDEIDPDDTGPFEHKREAKAQIEKNVKRMEDLQELMYAERKHALLIVLQAMDAGGKDGTI